MRQRRAPINEYRVDLGTPKIGIERFVDISYRAVAEPATTAWSIMLQERTIADKMDRQLDPSRRGALAFGHGRDAGA